MKGKFITFEGSEGCGKSTQSRLLAAYLKKRGYLVVYVREPGGTGISEQIRKILLAERNREMAKPAEMLLYMAARNQIVQEVIKPALGQGKIVVSDRFLDSTLAYQGYGLGMDIAMIKRIGKFATAGIKPDLTVFLDLPVKKGLRHRAFSQDRIEKRPLAYHQRVRRGYLRLALKEPRRIKIIKVRPDKNKTQQEIRKVVSSLMQGV